MILKINEFTTEPTELTEKRKSCDKLILYIARIQNFICSSVYSVGSVVLFFLMQHCRFHLAFQKAVIDFARSC